jgi:hypothetical protein
VTRSPLRADILSLALVVSACGGSDEPPLTDATSLACPAPGDLPFRLESHGFLSGNNKTLAANDPRNKDEASDVLGNPGGVVADVYLDDSASPTATAITYEGSKARTPPDQGLFSTPLPGENVSLWTFDGTAWAMLDRGVTGTDGHYELSGTESIANATPVYAMLEADGSCATHYDYLLPPGSKFVVMDIDGTLTTDDNQIVMQVTDDTYVPHMMTAASSLAQAWAAKGYPIVYLTARAHVFDEETRAWLDMLDFPKGPVITENGGEMADAYKTLWLQRMTGSFGWVPFAAYGNAATDITAYANTGIALDHTFIIGPNGGQGGTVAIPNMDYTQHITDFVNAQPDNQ